MEEKVYDGFVVGLTSWAEWGVSFPYAVEIVTTPNSLPFEVPLRTKFRDSHFPPGLSIAS